ncbi:YgiQ family radical SAM protein [Marinifaba aquimaris]|uniref:YgiQ family radical SAM protein n=1 Tax=Marinifaba aquimaris TaxID=2741323 RepID=UPI001FE51E2D|nr:YgiQ family radical SAM protein [Marinifaba aquimaris]
MPVAKDIFSYEKYQHRVTEPAPFLPMSRKEMDQLGWDSCDIIIVSGDAYVDHPSFGMAVIGRTLEAQGFRVGIIAQPDWNNPDTFKALGRPNLYFGVTAGNMDSMINRYTADRKIRHDDAYTPNNEGGKRPDRATLIYTQKCKQAYKDIPVVIGGIEASLRRIAHYDYWSDKVRRSILPDSKADILIFGNAERALLEVTHRIANGEPLSEIKDVRGTAVMLKEALPGWSGVDSSTLDKPGKIDAIPNPYMTEEPPCGSEGDVEEKVEQAKPIVVQLDNPANVKISQAKKKKKPWEEVYVNLPPYDKVRADKVLYAHTSRILHQETNPGCARALMQRHDARYVWINPPAIPLETGEMDGIFDLYYARVPHPKYGKAKIPAYDMIKTSINIMRGCFGGCTFCSITEHEGRIIQSRSEESIINEIEDIKEKVPGFTGVISDLGGPTANMYKLKCKSPKAEATCRRLSCVWPDICGHMDTDHTPTIDLYRRARDVKGIKKILIASGVRYDIAVEDPRYVKELAKHHVGGYLKIAPEHTEEGPLNKMMKPGMGTYYKFKELFDKYSKEAGKEQYLIPYFISSHPGTTPEDMVNLALWLKKNRFKLDQVQNFYPSPMATATTMYHTEHNPLSKISYKSDNISIAKGDRARRLQRALLRYHAPENFELIREGLKSMGLSRLIGRGPNHLVPPPSRDELKQKAKPARKGERAATKHTQAQYKDDPRRKPKRKDVSGTNKPNSSKSNKFNKNSSKPSKGKSGNAPQNSSRKPVNKRKSSK